MLATFGLWILLILVCIVSSGTPKYLARFCHMSHYLTVGLSCLRLVKVTQSVSVVSHKESIKSK